LAIIRIAIIAFLSAFVVCCTQTIDGNITAVDPVLQDAVDTRFGDLGVAGIFTLACADQVRLVRDDPDAAGILIVADLLQKGYSLADIRTALRQYNMSEKKKVDRLGSERFVRLLASYKVGTPDEVCRVARRLAVQNLGPGAYLARL
jgi:hypothetical protein